MKHNLFTRTTKKAMFLMLLAMISLIVPFSLFANTNISETKLFSSDIKEGDRFGQSVAITNERIVVGANLDEGTTSATGTAYIYEPDGNGGWLETEFYASDGQSDDAYGYSVASANNLIVVGSFANSENDTEAGAIYLYESDGNGGWIETKLLNSQGERFDEFGWDVDTTGDRIVVGHLSADLAVVYESDGNGGWIETQITGIDLGPSPQFGYSVATAGSYVFVGAFNDENGAGSVHVYESDGNGSWSGTKLTPSDGGASAQFGSEVVASEDYLVVDSSDAIYIYEDDGSGNWSETKLANSDDKSGFGTSLAVYEDQIVIGASDAVYIYDLDANGNWVETNVPASGGTTIATNGNLIVAGDPNDDEQGTDAGAIYLYELTSDNNDEDGDGVENHVDICPGSSIADDMPENPRKYYFYVNAEGQFVDGEGLLSRYTIADTAGCTSQQILELGSRKQRDNSSGVSFGGLRAWVRSVK